MAGNNNCIDDLTSVDVAHVSPATLSLSSSSTSSTISLFPFILQAQSHGLNLKDPESLPRLLRPVDSKDVVKSNDEVDAESDVGTANGSGGIWDAGCIDSQEGDDELIVHVRFSELCRVKSILIGTGGGRSLTSPRRVRVWVNRPNGIDFSTAEVDPPEQEWELLEKQDGSRGSDEYPVRISKFGNVSSLDLFFTDARSQSHSRLFYLGFMGECRVLKKEPGDALEIGAENAVQKMVDGAKEEKRGGYAAVR